MGQLFQNLPGSVTLSVMVDGEPTPVSGSVSAGVYRGKESLISSIDVLPDAAGAAWSRGIVVVKFTAEETKSLPLDRLTLVLRGEFGVKRFEIEVFSEDGDSGDFSCLDRDIAIQKFRADRLARSTMISVKEKFSDDYIWGKLRAAEKDLERQLRVTFTPCLYIPLPPNEEELSALDGVRWALDPGYDYRREQMQGDVWGMLKLRHTPVQDVEWMRVSYPKQTDVAYEYPKQWLRIYYKYGHLQIVPDGLGAFFSQTAYSMMMLMMSGSVPLMFHIRYTAGLNDAQKNWPDLIDAINKLAVIKMVEDKFFPQSGSISADGLSQSVSVDTAKYKGMIDAIVNGDDSGGNGGLMTAIHGIRMDVLA